MKPRDLSAAEGYIDLVSDCQDGVFFFHDTETDRDVVTDVITLENLTPLEVNTVAGGNMTPIYERLRPRGESSLGGYLVNKCSATAEVFNGPRATSYQIPEGTTVTELVPFIPKNLKSA